jgi:chaperone modulatory protein CbpM
MKSAKYELIVLRPRRDLLPIEDVASRAGVHPEIIRHFIDLGLIEPADRSTAEILLDPEAIHRVCVIQHLRGDLGVNLAGAGVILDLLDRLSASKGGGNRGYK